MLLFFNFVGPNELFDDDEGVEVTDLDEARRQALDAFRQLRKEDGAIRSDFAGWWLEIVDDAGTTMATIDLDLTNRPSDDTTNIV